MKQHIETTSVPDGGLAKGLDLAKAILQGVHRDATVKIETWNLPGAGFRVAEVSFSRKGRPGVDNFIEAGSTYMQSDLPWGLAICAQVERLVVTVAYIDDDREVQYEVDRLRFLVGLDH